MEDFLRECKNKLENLSNVEKVHVVLGSEACDLDSAVSTLVYSYFLYKICRDTNDIYLPVLNVSRKDFRLKTEVGYYFEENNINPSYILFKNEIDLKSLFKSGKLRLILLDHNTLPKDDVFMHPAIEEIIDHHKKCVDKYTLTDCSVVLEMVGSCASLVADKILVRDSNFFNYQLANLLYGAILLDTVGLDEKSGRVTEKDKQMLVKLEEYLPDVNRRVIFEKLQAAKMDITGLTVDESLRKDLKVVSISSVHIAISSLPVHIDKFVTKIATIDSLRRFNGDNNFQILIMMGIRVNKTTGEATRQLGVYSINIVCKQQVAEFLQVSCDLKLEPIELNIPTVSVFRQGNVSASRKVVLPLIQEYLAGYDTEKSARTRPSELTTNYRERNSSNNEEFNDFDPFESIDSLVFTPPNGITVSSSTNYLGVGDPLSLPLSSQNSSNQNSCPYTPQNSYADSDFGVEAFSKQLLPSFNSREMMEKIEIKRGKLRGYDGDTQENYPFTPKNSFVDSSFDSYAAAVAIDSDTLRQKLNENQAHLDVDGIGFINGTDGAKPEENGDDKSPDDNSVVSSTGDKSEEKMDISTSGSDKGYASSPATAAVNHTYDDDDVNSKNNITKPTSDYTTNLGALKMDSETGIKYQTETVDFPESPHHMKLLANRTNSRLRSVSLDDEAALDASSASDEMVVRKVLTESVLEDDYRSEKSDMSEFDDDYFEDSLVIDGLLNTDSGSHEHEILSARTADSGALSSLRTDCAPDDSRVSSEIDFNTVQKIRSCFDHERIKDIYTLSGRLQDILTPTEIDEILNNSDIYAEFIDDEILEALQNARTDIPSKQMETKNQDNNQRVKIIVDKSNLDDSFLDDLKVTAVFDEGNVDQVEEIRDSEMNNSYLKEKETSGGTSIRAIFEETDTLPTESTLKKRILAVQNEQEDNYDSISKFPLSWDSSLSDNSFRAEIEDFENFIQNISDVPTPEIHVFKETPERPTGFVKSKKKITVNPDILTENDDDGRSLSSLSNKSVDILSPGVDDVATPDDIETPDELDDSVLERMVSNSDPIPELSAAEEYDEERSWRTCFIAGVQRKIDMKVIEPYKKVLSHGGYCPDTRHAIIAFSACNLPDRSRKDYEYVMDNLFLYVLTTLDQLVAEDYILIYLQGATERSSMPSFGWLKRCYQMIDRRLRKNLKGLYLVHPSFWLKTIVLMTKPFISSKFSRKLRFVANLQELSELIPMDHVCIPDKVKQYDEARKLITQ